jgi:N-acyl-D-amino-acid deacylase
LHRVSSTFIDGRSQSDIRQGVTLEIFGESESMGPLNAAELDQMRALAANAMEDGAPGVASALIYQPGVYAKTDELIALAEVAARYHGIYISHMRNEGDREPEAIDELITIARQARIPAEIYHLKVSGEEELATRSSLDEIRFSVGT